MGTFEPWENPVYLWQNRGLERMCLAQDHRVNQWWHLSGPWDRQAALQPVFKPQINSWFPHESKTVSDDLATDEQDPHFEFLSRCMSVLLGRALLFNWSTTRALLRKSSKIQHPSGNSVIKPLTKYCGRWEKKVQHGESVPFKCICELQKAVLTYRTRKVLEIRHSLSKSR